MPAGASGHACRGGEFPLPTRKRPHTNSCLMESQPLNRIAEWCGGRALNTSAEAVARGISTDSRSVASGELFVAISGEKFDGHDFLGDVCAKGAAAAIVEERRLAALPP